MRGIGFIAHVEPEERRGERQGEVRGGEEREDERREERRYIQAVGTEGAFIVLW
jgi:hypothetical protein